MTKNQTQKRFNDSQRSVACVIAARQGLESAGLLLKIAMEGVSEDLRSHAALLVNMGGSFEVTYGGILGGEPHIRANLAADDQSMELFRIGLDGKMISKPR